MNVAPAADADAWLRWIFRKNEPQEGGSGFIKYCQEQFKVPCEHSMWLLELSGRLQSCCIDFTVEARSKAEDLNQRSKSKKGYAYRGLWRGEVRALRELFGYEVFHEPNEDVAHANLVVTKPELLDGTGKLTITAAEALKTKLTFKEAEQ